jgi:hypothetical protein
MRGAACLRVSRNQSISCGLDGVADVAALRAVACRGDGVRDHLRGGGIEEGEEWEAGASSESFQKRVSSRGVEGGFGVNFVDGNVDGDDVFPEDRVDLFGLNETIEFPAPASPGGAGDDEGGASVGFGFRGGEEGVGRRASGLRPGRRGQGQEELPPHGSRIAPDGRGGGQLGGRERGCGKSRPKARQVRQEATRVFSAHPGELNWGRRGRFLI